MATLKPELHTILERYDINPRDTSQVWDCRGTLVLYHKAYEIIAAKERIVFDAPQVIRGYKDEAVIVVTGKMGDRVEWSFGEAAIGQNYQVSGKQAAYPYAMAEKRAKDRVIAKLVGLAAYVYSEDEADEFKDGPRQPVEAVEPDDPRELAKVMAATIDQQKTLNALNGVMRNYGEIPDSPEPKAASPLAKLPPEGRAWIIDRANKRRGILAQAPSDKAASPLAKLPPEGRAWIIDRANKRRGILAQAPSDKAA